MLLFIQTKPITTPSHPGTLLVQLFLLSVFPGFACVSIFISNFSTFLLT